MRYPRRSLRLGARVLAVIVLAVSVASCGGSSDSVGEVTGFWFFSYSGDESGLSGEAFAYVTRDGTALGGGIASPPLGGPLSGSLEESRFSLRIEDTRGAPVVEVDGEVRDNRAEGTFQLLEGGSASGSFTAERFVVEDHPPADNPFLGRWTNFEDGGETTLVFDEDYRFTGSEGELDFTGSYAFDRRRNIVGVYEADESSVHMEMLTFRFESEDTVVLTGSTYRKQ
jgi:hypothetical protein